MINTSTGPRLYLEYEDQQRLSTSNRQFPLANVGRKFWRRSRAGMLQIQRIAALSHRDAGSRQDWKPATLKAPVLGCFIAASILVIVVLEILWHISSENGNTGASHLPKMSTACQ
jgi:hypothetical protein